MSRMLRTAVRPLVAGSTYRRWVHLILGGALLTPYVLLGGVLVEGMQLLPTTAPGWLRITAYLTAALAVATVTAVIPGVRIVEGAAARELLRGPAASLTTSRVRSWPDHCRTAAWFLTHLAVGTVLSILSLAVPPIAFTLATSPLTGADVGDVADLGGWLWPLAIAATVALVYLVAGVGALLARLAPRLLGPSPAERLAALERQAVRLAERNRLARELHDSVGHALSVVTVQAGAAGRVLASQPEFARDALAAIEETARGALADLDHVLGLLRDEAVATTPQPSLADLDDLLRRTRATGLAVTVEVTGDLAKVPAAVSREAYRIVQESLTNVLRHAGRVPAAVRLTAGGDELTVDISNPLPAGGGRPGRPDRGGRGLRGIAERVAVLRGDFTAAPVDGQWRVAVRVPVTVAEATRSLPPG